MSEQGATLSAKQRAEIEAKAQAYWKRNIRLITILLVVWATVSYVCAYFLALPLQDVFIGAVPFGFWFAQQGSILTFIVIILVYAVMMDRLDKEFELDEEKV